MLNRYVAFFFIFTTPGLASAETKWRAESLLVTLNVGYAVLAIDLSGDGKLDIAIVDSKRFIWLENPSWQTHVMQATPEAANDNVCFAPHDIDADGHVDFAIGHDWQVNNTASGGKVGWLKSPADPRDLWTYSPVGEQPTTHRMRWIDWDRDGKLDLVVAPLKGKNSQAPAFQDTGIPLLAFSPHADQAAEPWRRQVIDESLHVAHNIDVVDMDGDGQKELLAASFEGVTHFAPSVINSTSQGIQRTRLGVGQSGTAPAIGASEIRLGRLTGNERYLATIEPWHGDHVVVYIEPKAKGNGKTLWDRHVLDEQLKWGHAVACANLDDDPEQELIIGVRDDLESNHRCGVRIYDPKTRSPTTGTTTTMTWERQLVGPGQVAVEDLAVGDFDQDGDIDIVAVGRATHNAVIYWNEN